MTPSDSQVHDMSSEEEELARTGGKSHKKRRVGRACDMCRQKKVRCDGDEGRRCSNCITFDDECTYIHSAPKRRIRPKGYVERLELRVSQMEELLNRVCPGFDLLGDYGAAIEESTKLNEEYEDSDDADDNGFNRIFSASAMDLDFSHAIPPSLGSPPAPPLHMRKDSLNALSPIPVSAPFSFNEPMKSRSSSMDAHTPAEAESLESDDELTPRLSLPDQLAYLLDRPAAQSESEQGASTPISSTSYDKGTASPPLSSINSPRPSSSKVSVSRANFDIATNEKRFYGKSSTFTILKTAVDMKTRYWRSAGIVGGSRTSTDISSGNGSPEHNHDDHSSGSTPVPTSPDDNTSSNAEKNSTAAEYLSCGCPSYGTSHPWALPLAPANHVFPHSTLFWSLISSYFDIQNTYIPVLHRPTFERGVKEGRHEREEDFGSVVLLVCALGSRWFTDRTVLLGVGDETGRLTSQERKSKGTVEPQDMGPDSIQEDFWREGEDDEEWHSAGWKWFKQVRFGRKALYAPPNVLDLQLSCLATMYLRGSSSPEASRWITGVGLRLAQDMGVHRKKSYSATPNVEEETMKRAWWSLLWLDWSISPSLGRPCAIQHEDFDVDLLVECDDEYWESSDPASPPFVQPPNKPAVITFFNHMLKLNQIQAYALRTIYSTSKSRTILGFVGPQWEDGIVTELDSALNSWLNSLPDHLKWDPRNPNTTFLSQSAVLYSSYYALQITIHRPFIAYQRDTSTSTLSSASASTSRFPSLSICTTAARACVHVSEILCRRLGHGTHASLGVLHHNMMPLFTAAIVLMLNMWAGTDSQRQRGQRNKVKEMKEMADVHKAMDMLKVMEVRWHTAGRLWDMLYELAVVSDLPLPSSSHAAVIRSIKQNRRQPPKVATKPANGKGSASIAPGSHPRRLPTPKVDTSKTAASKATTQSGPMTALDMSTYQSDPMASWCQYDLTPSVFSQPAASETTSPVDPALDSVFTSRSRTRSQTLGEASSMHAQTSSDNSPERAKTLDSSAYSVNADFAMLFAPTRSKDASSQGPIPSTSRNGDMDVPHPRSVNGPIFHTEAREYQPLDTITQVLDSIQLRQADWPANQPRNDQFNLGGPVGWNVGAVTTSMDDMASLSGGTYNSSAGTNEPVAAVGVRPEAVALWASVPEGFEWDEWGTYINTIGSNAPGIATMRHPGPMRNLPASSSSYPHPHMFSRHDDPAFLSNL